MSELEVSRDDAGISHRSALLVIGLYALLSLLVIPVYPHFISSNEFTRWALTVSLVEARTTDITITLPLLGPGLEDLSVKDGRIFTNKPPGLSMLTIPAYMVARAAVGPPRPENMRTTLNEMRLLGATVPAILLALTFVPIARRYGIDDERTALVLFSMLFATPLLAYGLLLFAHAIVAAALFGAWYLLHLSSSRSELRFLYAGLLLGLAVFCEYTAAIPVLVLTLSALDRSRVSRFLLVVAGGLPFAVALGAYHYVAFGGVLALPSAYEYYGPISEMRKGGLFGIHVPSLRYLLKLLFDPAKGLLVFSPFLLLTVSAWRSAYGVLPRRAWITMILVPASIILMHAGYPDWHGGWTVGARYLVPALPFLLVAFLFRTGSRAELLLIGASLAIVVPTSLVFPFVAPEVPMPWITFAGWLLAKGLVIPNLMHFVWRPLAIALPFAVVGAGAAFAARRRSAWMFAGVAGAWLISFALIAAFPAPRIVRYERAYTAEIYFDRPGTLEREFPGEVIPEGFASRRIVERHKPPATWPF